jgi:hypothetical protein
MLRTDDILGAKPKEYGNNIPMNNQNTNVEEEA